VLRLNGAHRPITRQPVTAQQLQALVREIAPRNAQRAILAGGPASFTYRSATASSSPGWRSTRAAGA
jgi:hypothetical protein